MREPIHMSKVGRALHALAEILDRPDGAELTPLAERASGSGEYDKRELEQLYSELNRELFGNKLPDIEMGFMRSRRELAHVRARVTKKENGVPVEAEPYIMEWSVLYAAKGDQLAGLMVHEMIHVKLFAIDKIVYTTGRDKLHGREFMDELKRLQKKVPFKIPTTENSDAVKAASVGGSKKFYGMLIRDKTSGEVYVMRLTKPAYSDRAAMVAAVVRVEASNGGKFEVMLMETSNPEVQLLPAKRSVKKVVPYKLKPELQKELWDEAVELHNRKKRAKA